jgi:hypothetical protein
VQQKIAAWSVNGRQLLQAVVRHFTVTDNLAVAPTDYDPFSITAPVDARLPDGGGYFVGGLGDLSRRDSQPAQNYVTLSDSYGAHNSSTGTVWTSTPVPVSSGACCCKAWVEHRPNVDRQLRRRDEAG